ncbi:MAG: hypothetical protein ACXAD7_16665 [Candidatus Kariarchaeaceae archaeon]|jgi:hypothetical protein
MALSLIVSTIIPLIVFLPLAYYTFKVRKDFDHLLRNFITGGLAWSITALIIYLPTSLLLDQSTITSYQAVLDVDDLNKRTLAFWVLMFNSIISEVVRWRSISDTRFVDTRYSGLIIHGFGWTFAEYITRYLFFIDNGAEDKYLYQSLLFVLLFFSNSSLAILLLRTTENTKFVMFAAFMRYFLEFTLYGSFGYNLEISNAFQRVGAIVGLQVLLVYLSTISGISKRKLASMASQE